MTRFARLTGVAVILAGCHAHVPPADVDRPAILANPGARSRAELASVVSRAMNGAPVAIADSALTADDLLIVERTPRRDAEGRELDGRELGRPERFRLVRSGARCVLVHERTGRRWTLDQATCSPR